MSELLWFLTRASALVAMVLLTVTVVLGALTTGRAAPVAIPVAARTALHRTVSGVAFVFTALHVVTVIADGYVDIGWLSLVVPFSSAYDPFWVGLGTLAFDLVLAVAVTSLLRDRLPLRLWRVLHLAGYPLWAVALAHGLGSSTSDGAVMLGVAVVCGLAGTGALVWRLAAGRRRPVPAVPTQAWR